MSSEPRPRAALPGAIGALRWVLLALLIAAAAAALLGLPRAFQAEGTSALRLVPVALLVLFVGGYAAYRFALVRAGRYPAGKALVRVGLDCGFPLEALVTRRACEDLGLAPGQAVCAVLKAAAIHLVPHD